MFALSLEGQLHRTCGGHFCRAGETVTIRVSGMSATIEREVFRCDRCGDEQRSMDERERAEQEAIAAIRSTNALLAPREIRALRERLGLTHQQVGDLLYGTPGQIVEGWERGRYLQNAAADAMLRSLDDADALRRRAARAGVILRPPADMAADAPSSGRLAPVRLADAASSELAGVAANGD
ncbi:MAG: type II TA system antitoxin MqsA family protein [Gemmatimonadaceae bacterium]